MEYNYIVLKFEDGNYLGFQVFWCIKKAIKYAKRFSNHFKLCSLRNVEQETILTFKDGKLQDDYIGYYENNKN